MSRENIEEMAKVIGESLLSVLGIRLNDDILARLAQSPYNAGYRKQSELTPCDVCKFNPPSSGDGKPCLVCPAQAKMKGGAE